MTQQQQHTENARDTTAKRKAQRQEAKRQNTKTKTRRRRTRTQEIPNRGGLARFGNRRAQMGHAGVEDLK